MLFVSITEYGASDTAFENLLNDLRDRADRLRGTFGFGHDLVVTFGTTDLIEIACFDHYFHFAELGGSAAEAFRRSVGAYCFTLPPSAPRDPSIHAIEDVLSAEGNASCPFLAVMYLKLSPAPMLAMPVSPSRPLIHSLVERFCSPDLHLWEKSRNILRSTIGHVDAERFSRQLRVAVLVGLDAVELILLVRAVCLEQISALAWTVRNQTLGDFWNHTNHAEAVTRMQKILGVGREDSQADPFRLPDDWDASPLFVGTTSVVGLPLRRGRANRKWVFEALDDPDHEAARNALVTVRTSFTSGRFDKSIEPIPLFTTAVPGATARRSDTAGQDGQQEAGESTVAEQIESDTVFLMLFDRADTLMLPGPTDSGGLAAHVCPCLVRELQEHLGDLAGLESRDTAKEGVRTHTELAVRVRISREIASDVPNDILLKLFRERLRKQREEHFQRTAKYSRSWTYRWLAAAKKVGIVYSTTNKVVKVIHTVLEHLDSDLEGFVDLLPILAHFMDAVERPEILPEDIIWFVRVIENATATRCRQDHPLRAPHVSLALEGNAGYRLARDAFIHFAESVCEAVDPLALLVVRDSSSGGVTCGHGPARWNILRVSTVTLYHPVHWLAAPALAHGRLEHTTLADVERENAIAAEILRAICDDIEIEVVSEESLGRLLRRTRAYMRQGSGGKLPTFFLDALRNALDSLFADLCLWRSLEVPGDSASRTRKRFWFLHGPGLLLFAQYKYGFKTPDPGIVLSLIVRCALVSHLLDRGTDGWLEALTAAVRRLREGAALLRDRDAPPERPQLAVSARLECIKEDLRIPDVTWADAIELLWESLHCARDRAPRCLRAMDRWIAFSAEAWENLFQFSEDADYPRLLYARYIGELIDLWGREADPWLPFTMSHRKERVLLRTFRLENAPFGPTLLRRGGILVQRSLKDYESQREYRLITYDVMAKLGESARPSRTRKVLSYLGDSPTESAIS